MNYRIKKYATKRIILWGKNYKESYKKIYGRFCDVIFMFFKYFSGKIDRVSYI